MTLKTEIKCCWACQPKLFFFISLLLICSVVALVTQGVTFSLYKAVKDMLLSC